jgi:hypothetical protein
LKWQRSFALRLFIARNAPLLFAILLGSIPASATADCIPPERPFLPQSREDMRAYADLIRADFETYIADVQEYFRCLDTERARAFVEAREVSDDYGRFLSAEE